jgi:hypothetical protein
MNGYAYILPPRYKDYEVSLDKYISNNIHKCVLLSSALWTKKCVYDEIHALDINLTGTGVGSKGNTVR